MLVVLCESDWKYWSYVRHENGQDLSKCFAFEGILGVKFLSSNLLNIHHQQTELSMREVDELMQHQLSEAQRRQVKTWINQTYMYIHIHIYTYMQVITWIYYTHALNMCKNIWWHMIYINLVTASPLPGERKGGKGQAQRFRARGEKKEEIIWKWFLNKQKTFVSSGISG